MSSTLNFLVRHSTHRLASERNKHSVTPRIMAKALVELKRDGYERAHNLMSAVAALAPGETLELSEADRKALRMARGCTDNTLHAIGWIAEYGTVTRA